MIGGLVGGDSRRYQRDVGNGADPSQFLVLPSAGGGVLGAAYGVEVDAEVLLSHLILLFSSGRCGGRIVLAGVADPLLLLIGGGGVLGPGPGGSSAVQRYLEVGIGCHR